MSDRLYRSRNDRMLAGVAGGLAELWDADPSLVRVIWALLVVFTGGLALVVYIVMAFVVPEDDVVYPAAGFSAAPAAGSSFVAGSPPASSPATSSPGAPPVSGSGWVPPASDPRIARHEARAARRAARGNGIGSGFPGAVVVGGILIVLGGFFLAREFLPQLDFDFVWPLFLIGIGIVLLVTAFRRPRTPD